MHLRAGKRVPLRGSQAAPLGVHVRPEGLLMGRLAEDAGESNVTFMQNEHGHVSCWQIPAHRCRGPGTIEDEPIPLVKPREGRGHG